MIGTVTTLLCLLAAAPAVAAATPRGKAASAPLVAVPAHAADPTARRIAALRVEATDLKTKGNLPLALTRAREAVAVAEKDPGRNDINLFDALDLLSEHMPDVDLEQQFALYDRMVPVAFRAKGAASYPAASILAGRNALAFVLRKPGASIPAFADALNRAAPLASSDREKAQITGLAMILAQLYDATGQHPKAVEIVGTIGNFYDVPPAVPNSSYAPGLMSLALRYADWQDFAKAIDAADRAIDASVAFYGRRNVEIVSALRVRGNALMSLGRYAEAEVAFRESATLTDSDPDAGRTSSALLSLARLYMATGRDALALPLLERTAEMMRSIGPAQSTTRMVALIELHNIAVRAQDYGGALRYARLAREDADARGFGQSANYVAILLAIANGAIPSDQLDIAAESIDALDALLPKVASAGNSRYAEALIARGRLEARRGNLAEAARLLRSGLDAWAKSQGADRLAIASGRATLSQVLVSQGDGAGAWRAGRTSASDMTKVIVDRAGRGGTQSLDGQSATVFESSIDAAWAVSKRR